MAVAAFPTILPWTPTPKQEEAIRLLGLHPYLRPDPEGPVEELLYGGAAGPGKSGLLIILIAMLAQEWPKSKVGVFRLTYTNLYDTIVQPLQALLPDGVAIYNDTYHELRWANGSLTRFRALEDEPSTYKKQRGPEYDAILVDEATEMTVGMITFINTRCRSTAPNWRPLKVYATNPIGPSTTYFADNFVDAAPWGTTFLAPPRRPGGRPTPRCFLPGRIDDNPNWADLDAVVEELENIADPELRAAMLEGNWHISSGTFFRPFRRDLHVLHLEPADYQDWTRLRGYDYGLDLGLCLWLARRPGPGPLRTHVYRELQLRNLPAQLQAQQIVSHSYHDPPIRMTLSGHDVRKRTGSGTKVGVRIMDELAMGRMPVSIANTDRRTGWDRVHRAIYWSEEFGRPPELTVDPSCTELIRELSNAQRDPKKPWDIIQPQNPTDPRDDGLDALRMALMGARAATLAKSEVRTWGLSESTPVPSGRRRGR